MSVVEFFLIPVSLVIGLAFARLLDGLYVVCESAAPYWVHTLWLVNKLAQIVLQIWAWRGMIDGGPETFSDLLLAMGSPTIIYLQALVLVGHRANSGTDWARRFYATRVRFFSLNCAMIVVTGMGIERFEVASGILPLLPLFALSLLGVRTRSRPAHAFIACAASLGFLLGLGVPILAGS